MEEKVPKTSEELAEMELKDQTIERIFRKWLALKPEESESTSEKYDIREDYLL
jgi:hypothetical protein